jgi:hypothetical protein
LGHSKASAAFKRSLKPELRQDGIKVFAALSAPQEERLVELWGLSERAGAVAGDVSAPLPLALLHDLSLGLAGQNGAVQVSVLLRNERIGFVALAPVYDSV